MTDGVDLGLGKRQERAEAAEAQELCSLSKPALRRSLADNMGGWSPRKFLQ